MAIVNVSVPFAGGTYQIGYTFTQGCDEKLKNDLSFESDVDWIEVTGEQFTVNRQTVESERVGNIYVYIGDKKCDDSCFHITQGKVECDCTSFNITINPNLANMPNNGIPENTEVYSVVPTVEGCNPVKLSTVIKGNDQSQYSTQLNKVEGEERWVLILSDEIPRNTSETVINYTMITNYDSNSDNCTSDWSGKQPGIDCSCNGGVLTFLNWYVNMPYITSDGFDKTDPLAYCDFNAYCQVSKIKTSFKAYDHTGTFLHTYLDKTYTSSDRFTGEIYLDESIPPKEGEYELTFVLSISYNDEECIHETIQQQTMNCQCGDVTIEFYENVATQGQEIQAGTPIGSYTLDSVNCKGNNYTNLSAKVLGYNQRDSYYPGEAFTIGFNGSNDSLTGNIITTSVIAENIIEEAKVFDIQIYYKGSVCGGVYNFTQGQTPTCDCKNEQTVTKTFQVLLTFDSNSESYIVPPMGSNGQEIIIASANTTYCDVKSSTESTIFEGQNLIEYVDGNKVTFKAIVLPNEGTVGLPAGISLWIKKKDETFAPDPCKVFPLYQYAQECLCSKFKEGYDGEIYGYVQYKGDIVDTFTYEQHVNVNFISYRSRKNCYRFIATAIDNDTNQPATWIIFSGMNHGSVQTDDQGIYYWFRPTFHVLENSGIYREATIKLQKSLVINDISYPCDGTEEVYGVVKQDGYEACNCNSVNFVWYNESETKQLTHEFGARLNTYGNYANVVDCGFVNFEWPDGEPNWVAYVKYEDNINSYDYKSIKESVYQNKYTGTEIPTIPYDIPPRETSYVAIPMADWSTPCSDKSVSVTMKQEGLHCDCDEIMRQLSVVDGEYNGFLAGFQQICYGKITGFTCDENGNPKNYDWFSIVKDEYGESLRLSYDSDSITEEKSMYFNAYVIDENGNRICEGNKIANAIVGPPTHQCDCMDYELIIDDPITTDIDNPAHVHFAEQDLKVGHVRDTLTATCLTLKTSTSQPAFVNDITLTPTAEGGYDIIVDLNNTPVQGGQGINISVELLKVSGGSTATCPSGIKTVFFVMDPE